MMVCAGASEQSVSQWSSALAEKSLGIPKTIGDLAGPMAFAILMGIARAFYGKYGDKIKLDHFMIYSCILCIISYVGIAFIPIPVLSLVCCAITGLSVGIMWPGTLSIAATDFPEGGTAIFGILAMAGDIGCMIGPETVAVASKYLTLSGSELKAGILVSTVFPVIFTIIMILNKKTKKTP